MSKTDEEQIEDLKKWWEKNGKFVIILLLAVVCGVVGGRAWNNYQDGLKANASSLYDQMMEAVQGGNKEAALTAGGRLVESYSESAYAVLAALNLAKLEVEKGDTQSARTRLSWAIDKAQMDSLKHVARLRLTQLLLDANELDQALSQTAVPDAGEFASAYSALKGDIYSKQGKLGEARIAYQQALERTDLAPQLRRTVQMKLDDLGVEEGAKS
ncbi:MAG: tetratricopeptide repeat protein [Gammaproteobacteria bacterium]|nr:tetratricopeptide repeat protein [Gammaproteobacteria bacterium]